MAHVWIVENKSDGSDWRQGKAFLTRRDAEDHEKNLKEHHKKMRFRVVKYERVLQER